MSLVYDDSAALTLSARPLPAGDYTVGLRVTALDGTPLAASQPVTVDPAQATAGFRATVDTANGAQFLYPADWLPPATQEGVTFTRNISGTAQLQVRAYPGWSGDLAALQDEVLITFGQVSVLQEEPATVGPTEAAVEAIRTAYGYDSAEQGARTGAFLTFLKDGVGFVVDLDGPREDEATTVATLDTIAATWQFLPPRLGFGPEPWSTLNVGDFRLRYPANFAYEEYNTWQRFAADSQTFVAVRVQPAARTPAEAMSGLLGTAAEGVTGFTADEPQRFFYAGRVWERNDFSYSDANGNPVRGLLLSRQDGETEIAVWAEAPDSAADLTATVFLPVAASIDRLVNQAGEVSITRARIDADVRQLQGWLGELTDSLDRMRRQLRDIELHAETQISSRIEATKAAALSFDPLEMDRFTRFQELTRFMAESVNDVATLQRSLQRTLQSTEDELAAQARLTRELQDDLLRTRMVEFESLSDRLYRTVRQAARDTGKPVRLDIEGGAIEVDRGVLDRMIGPFEHLLRNAVAHGIELPRQRAAAGKPEGGRITIAVAQAGNEVAVEIADDGAGLDLQRIRQRGFERGLIDPDRPFSDAELAQLIFSPGFSTADSVTELAGRGVGLDVVRAEVNAMGGRIETVSSPGQGTRFKLLLPLTTAVTQVVMLRCGEQQVAVPSTLIEVVRRASATEVERAYAEGTIDHEGEVLPFFWLAALLQSGTRGDSGERAQAVVIVRSAAQRVAVHVDEVVGNEEVVVKNVGPQLARLPGLAGVTLLPSGAVALIYNPVALASVYAEAARQLMRAGVVADTSQPAQAPPLAPLVMVVDDSLTVRRVTQRLLVREGWRVVTAKDGLDALEQLAEERPLVLLSDIEMPRMDGFDLVRNLRADPRLADLPVIMITSRIAQKHRDYAAELGVQHFLGKPYSEDELLALVARYAGAAVPDILT